MFFLFVFLYVVYLCVVSGLHGCALGSNQLSSLTLFCFFPFFFLSFLFVCLFFALLFLSWHHWNVCWPFFTPSTHNPYRKLCVSVCVLTLSVSNGMDFRHRLSVYLRDIYRDNAGRNMPNCAICKAAVVYGEKCKYCMARIHRHCLSRYCERIGQDRCPQCKKEWEGTIGAGASSTAKTSNRPNTNPKTAKAKKAAPAQKKKADEALPGRGRSKRS